MATITGLTAERMITMEQATVIDGEIQGDNLILVTRGGTEIDTGSVRGPAGPPGPPTDAEAIGTMKMWAGAVTSIPTKYLPCDGTVRNIADYPDLAAVLGSLWGTLTATTFTLPNMRDYFPMGGATPGATGGFADAALPAHVHTQPTHTHTLSSHTHNSDPHTHTMNHDHAQATSSAIGDHQHVGYMRRQAVGSGTYAGHFAGGADGSGNLANADTNLNGGHSHTVNLPSYTGNTGSTTPAPTGGPSNNNSSAAGGENTGTAGVTPTGLNRPPYKVVPFMIRALA